MSLELERLFPYFTKAHSGVKPVENRQWHRNMGDDWPGPFSSIEWDLKMTLNIKPQLNFWRAYLDGMNISPVGLQGENCPNGQVAYQQKGHNFPARLVLHLILGSSIPAWGIKDEHCLQSGLHKSCQWGKKAQWVLLKLEESPNHAKSRVNVHSSLGHNQEQIVQL